MVDFSRQPIEVTEERVIIPNDRNAKPGDSKTRRVFRVMKYDTGLKDERGNPIISVVESSWYELPT